MVETNKNPLARFFTRYRLVTLIVFILVSLWAYYNFVHGHRGFSVFIIAFFLVSIFLPKPSFTLVLITVISYVLLSSVSLPALGQIRATSAKALEHPSIPINNLLTPGSGLEVLPEEALQVLSLIEANEVESYQISPLLNDDYHLMQRIVESAWPVRMKDNSPHVFIRLEELPDFSSCQLVDQKELIALVFCD